MTASVAIAAVVVAAIGIGVAGVLMNRGGSEAPSLPMRFSILPPEGGAFLTPLTTGSAAPVGGTVSPDGRLLAYTASDASGTVSLWVRPLESVDARPLSGTEGAALPFWSPDSRSLGFFGEGTLNRVDVSDGSVQVLCDVIRGRGGSWNRDGVIVFAPWVRSGLRQVEATGGASQVVTTLGEGQLSHGFPYFLPDGRHFLYYAEHSQPNTSGVFVGDLNGGTTRVAKADSAAVYAPTGHLLFVRQGALFAQPFDLTNLGVTGRPLSLATSLPHEGTSPAFSVSNTGVLTYQSGPPDRQQFAWFDRTGRLLETIGGPGNYRGVDLSPDGQRVAVHAHEGNGGDIWVFEPRGTTTRVTFDPSQDNSSPIWSPDGARLAFGSLRHGKWGIYHKQADQTASDTMLIESDTPKIPSAWSGDGASLVYWLFSSRSIDTWLLPLARGRRSNGGQPAATATAAATKGVPLMSTPFYEGHAQISPDGRWIAYGSTENGAMQVFVRRFPVGGAVWQVSLSGGVTPRWGRDGRNLFYVTSYNSGTLMAVPVEARGDTFVAGTPRELFNTGLVAPWHSTSVITYHTYAVSPDSRRFLIARPASTLRGERAARITIVLNWNALLDAERAAR